MDWNELEGLKAEQEQLLEHRRKLAELNLRTAQGVIDNANALMTARSVAQGTAAVARAVQSEGFLR